MKTMWRARYNLLEVEEFEVIKETDKIVAFIDGNRAIREHKSCNYHKWCNTRDEAVQILVKDALKDIEDAVRVLRYKRRNLRKIEEKFNL